MSNLEKPTEIKVEDATVIDTKYPKPDAYNHNKSGANFMWIIKDYKIWANTYPEALKLLPLIESF
jgi:hypothetical protein